MKALIFDLDNTLIMWRNEFIFALENTLKSINLDFNNELLNKIDEMINLNEKFHDKLSKEEFLEFINKNCNTNLTLDWVDSLIEEQKKLYYEDKELERVLDYLSKKYDLYVVTNWFTDTQKGRLENMGLLKYFKEVYGADINYFKPNIKSFDIVIDKYGKENCISIGDTLENDYELPIKLGMDAYLLSDKDIDNVKTIKSLNELMNIL